MVSMNNRILSKSQVEGILWGLVVIIMLTLFGIPPAFAFVAGIIMGVVAGFVLNVGRKGD